jgi:hypothetical protein
MFKVAQDVRNQDGSETKVEIVYETTGTTISVQGANPADTQVIKFSREETDSLLWLLSLGRPGYKE